MQGTIAVIGAGRAGSALAVLLGQRGWTIGAIASERLAQARRLARLCGAKIATTDPAAAARGADCVILAVPDREIPRISRTLARARNARAGSLTSGVDRWRALPARPMPPGASQRAALPSESGNGPSRPPPVALHTSGASGARLLDPLRKAGWSAGSFHPLFAFPPAGREIVDLAGTSIALDGDPAALKLARAMASSLGAKALSIAHSERATYHLAACFASNYMVTLAAEGVDLLAKAGLDRRKALRVLLPLMRASLRNLEICGLPSALTGPVARGDDDTVRRHARVLRRAPVELKELHRLLVRRTARLARSTGRLDAAASRRIERALRSLR